MAAVGVADLRIMLQTCNPSPGARQVKWLRDTACQVVAPGPKSGYDLGQSSFSAEAANIAADEFDLSTDPDSSSGTN